MSVVDQAYAYGQQAAFEKFAAGLSAAAIRGAVPRVPFAGAAASNTVPSPRSLLGKAAPAVPPGGPVAGAPAAAAAPAAAGSQNLLQRAWGGLNRMAANPVGQIALGVGAPMLIGSLGSNGSQQ
jgi:hypothetical protein